MSTSNFHIVFPCGDRTRLAVAEICFGMEYELSDYAVASRESFPNYDDAAKYAEQLARENQLQFQPDRDHPVFLD